MKIHAKCILTTASRSSASLSQCRPDSHIGFSNHCRVVGDQSASTQARSMVATRTARIAHIRAFGTAQHMDDRRPAVGRTDRWQCALRCTYVRNRSFHGQLFDLITSGLRRHPRSTESIRRPSLYHGPPAGPCKSHIGPEQPRHRLALAAAGHGKPSLAAFCAPKCPPNDLLITRCASLPGRSSMRLNLLLHAGQGRFPSCRSYVGEIPGPEFGGFPGQRRVGVGQSRKDEVVPGRPALHPRPSRPG